MSAPNSEYLVLIFASMILMLFLAGFIVSALHLYQRKQIAFQKNLAEIKRSHEKHLLETKLEIQEQTFRDISREIHDNISAGLTLSKLHLHALAGPGIPAEPQKNIALCMDLITRAIRDLRNIARSFDADTVVREGLQSAIENRICSLRNTGLFNIEYRVAGMARFLEPDVVLICFRIVQESLNNIIKHSKARNIQLSLFYRDTTLELKIEDDGIGLPAEKLQAGSGLRNIRQRASLLNGKCKITGIPGKGTSIQINIPFDTHHPLNHSNEQTNNADQDRTR